MRKIALNLLALLILGGYSSPVLARKCSDFSSSTWGAGFEDIYIASSNDTCTLGSYVITPINQSNIPFTTSGYGTKSPEDLIDGGYDLTIKPYQVISKTPERSVGYYSSMDNAITSIGSEAVTLVIDQPVTVTATATIPSTMALRFVKPGKIIVNTGVTLTINAPFSAPFYKIFDYVGTGTTVITRQTPLALAWWGATGDGVTDNSGALQAALDASLDGGVFLLHYGTFLFSNPVYLDSSTSDASFIIAGAGRGTILKPDSGLDNKYLFYCNEDSGGSKVISAPGHPKYEFRDMTVDGSGASTASFVWSDRVGVTLRNIYMKGLLFGLQTTDYCDLVEVSQVHWASPATDASGQFGYAVKLSELGDGLIIHGLIAANTSPPTVYLNKCKGGVISGMIQGKIVLQRSENVIIEGCHFENHNATDVDTDGTTIKAAISIFKSQHILIQNNRFHNTAGGYPIYLAELSGSDVKPKFDVTLRDNSFITFIEDATTSRVEDIYIQSATTRSTLRLDNNAGVITATGVTQKTTIGVLAASADSEINSLLSVDKKWYLSGDIRIQNRDIGGTNLWVMKGDTAPPHKLGQPSLTVSRSTTYPGSIANGTTYYYVIAWLTEHGSSQKSVEKNATTSADNDCILLTAEVTPKSYLRIWRGTSSGTYTNYVDIPCGEIAGWQNFWDQGSYIAGLPWLSSPPSAPTVNTTQTFTDGDATPSVAGGGIFLTNNSAGTTITDFDDGLIGDEVWVIVNDANTTIDFTGTNLHGNSGADWSPVSGNCLRCVNQDGTNWYCTLGE